MNSQNISNLNLTKLSNSLDQVVAKLSLVQELTPAKIRKVILEADIHPEELLPWADYDHPVEDSYGRKLVYKGDNFEIMVMSWVPGDFSTIHDHGHTQWGAVQIFGPAEHATFRWEDDRLITLSRMQVEPYTVVGVNHSLIHQMGNPTNDTPFLTLHIYGDVQPTENVTGDARIFNLEEELIERVDGGVFYELPEFQINTKEKGPKGDFPTWLRNKVERIKRLRTIAQHNPGNRHSQLSKAENSLFSNERQAQLLHELSEILDESGHVIDEIYWRILKNELIEAWKLQNIIIGENRTEDAFQNYAFMYDELIGKPCFESFMKSYLEFFFTNYDLDPEHAQIISLGCGTGLIESFMVAELGISYDKLLGIDISPSMVEVAQKRINAIQGDLLSLPVTENKWSMAYSGLNVLHYLTPSSLPEAIDKIAQLLQPGGYFVGDFITPDHIRWYPNMMQSSDSNIIGLRNPELIENEGRMFQESELININFNDHRMRITYSGKHKRFLPPMNRVRAYFKQSFGGLVELYDAVTLEPIAEHADSCKSTRYLLVAQKME